MENTIYKIIRENRTSISLKIQPNGLVVIRAPRLIPKIFIDNFIKKHERFIEKHRLQAQSTVPVKKRYIEGEKFMFLGNEYTLTFGDYKELKIYEDKFLFPKALLFRAEKEIETWYLKQARANISALVNEYALLMNTSFAELRFSDTSSKWGSCTHDNRLQFNWRLIMAPLIVVRYVVIHELAHTTEKNHSRAFWGIVSKMNPSYKAQIRWLKTHGNKLVF